MGPWDSGLFADVSAERNRPIAHGGPLIRAHPPQHAAIVFYSFPTRLDDSTVVLGLGRHPSELDSTGRNLRSERRHRTAESRSLEARCPLVPLHVGRPTGLPDVDPLVALPLDRSQCDRWEIFGDGTQCGPPRSISANTGNPTRPREQFGFGTTSLVRLDSPPTDGLRDARTCEYPVRIGGRSPLLESTRPPRG
jgi:hypothetical protein